MLLNQTGNQYVVTPNSGNTGVNVTLGGKTVATTNGVATLAFIGSGGTVTVNGESGTGSTDVFTVTDTSVQFSAADGLNGTTINFPGTGITRNVDAAGTTNIFDILGTGTGGSFNLVGDSGTNSFVFSGSSKLLGTIKAPGPARCPMRPTAAAWPSTSGTGPTGRPPVCPGRSRASRPSSALHSMTR